MSAPFAMEATGAVCSAGHLFIATIKPDPGGRLRLVKSRSKEFRLHERSPDFMQSFAGALFGFVAKKGIEELTFVLSPKAGPHMGSCENYMVEGVLYLLQISIRQVTSSAISAMETQLSVGMPAADRERLNAQDAKTQSRAILAAMHTLVERKRAAEAAANPKAQPSAEDLLRRYKERERRRELEEREALIAQEQVEAEAIKNCEAHEQEQARRRAESDAAADRRARLIESLR